MCACVGRSLALNEDLMNPSGWVACFGDSFKSYVIPLGPKKPSFCRYQPDEDRSLDMHVDECDVTFNFGLTNSDDFRGRWARCRCACLSSAGFE